MLVSEKHKALIMRLRDPQRVLSVIPTAKIIRHAGNEYVAVKHGPEEAQVLRNIGLKPPSPIRYHYKWPGKTPFKAQIETAVFATMHNRCFILNEMGTGKTMAVLWAYDYLRQAGVLRSAVVLCPKSTMTPVWENEIFRNFPDLTTTVVWGDRQKRLRLLRRQADVYIINHDGLKVKDVVNELNRMEHVDLVIVDELAQVARNAGTDRFRALAQVCNVQLKGRRRVWGLTGLPTPRLPTDAWAQCRLVVPGAVPMYFKKFQDSVMRQLSQYKWEPRPDAMQKVHAAMQPAIRFTRDECFDMPECVYEHRDVSMSKEQEKAYKEMLNKLKTELAEGAITAVNEGVKTSKLLQICCGVAYGQGGEEIVVDSSDRLAVLEEILDGSEGKVIVFVPYVAAVNYVADKLQEHGYTVARMWGDTALRERNEIFQAFQYEADPRVLVAQPACMSHGVTATAANTIVWYSAIMSNDIYRQANARITRAGQTRTQFIITLAGSAVERKYYKRLENQQASAGILLELVEESRAEGLDREAVAV